VNSTDVIIVILAVGQFINALMIANAFKTTREETAAIRKRVNRHSDILKHS